MSAGIENYGLMLSEGVAWLDNRSSGAFAGLSPEARDAVFRAALSQPVNTLPNVFAHRVRTDTLTLYYRDSRAWVGLRLTAPIQPAGYADFDEPPA